MWTLILSPQAQKFYEELTGKHKVQLSNAFIKLTQDPHVGKTLKGELRGFWSFRVGVYRVIYTIVHQRVCIELLRVQHRKEVYERFKGR